MIKNYPGAKSGTGIIQWLINNIPFHDRYFELFAGSAQLYYAKQPAETSILNDLDLKVCKSYPGTNHTYIFNNSATDLLKKPDYPTRVRVKGDIFVYGLEYLFKNLSRADFIYLDPPYPFSSRRSGKKYYQHEMTDSDHVQLLTAIRAVDANIMISTRQNDLYDQYLHDWRKASFETMDRAGRCTEIIYMNYPVPGLLHQYDYVGNGYTDRQRVKRKITRFTHKIANLPDYEKHMFIQQLIKNDAASVQHFLTMASGADSQE